MRTSAKPQFTPDYATPPGATLQDWLDERGMTQAEVAQRLNMSAKTVNQIIRGRAPLTPETADRLETVTSVPARMWNSLEAVYQGHLARIYSTERLMLQLEFLDEMPMPALRKRGIISAKPSDKVGALRQLLAFFSVADPAAYRNLWQSPQAAFRKSATFTANPGAVSAWLRLGEIEAADVDSPAFDKTLLRESLPELRALTRVTNPEVFHPQLIEMVRQAGVVMLFIPDVTGSRCSGATRWVNNRPVVQLSLRHKTDDQMWFTIFHELAHVLLHSRQGVFIDGTFGDDADSIEEREASEFAANLLIPRDRLAEFAALKSLGSVTDFAAALGISPGIVVGRLQREHYMDRDRGNGLKIRYQFSETS